MELRDSARSQTILLARPLVGVESNRFSDIILAKVDRYRYWLLGALFVIYLLGFNAQWRIERDSALYLSIGRNLAEGHGYTFRGKLHELAFPGLPLLFAAIFRACHTQSLTPALVLMLLMGWAALGVTYRMFLLIAGRPTAVLMTLGLGVTRLFYRYCFELLSDLPFFLGVMAFLAGYEAIFVRRSAAPDGAPSGRRADRPPARWYDWSLLLAGLALAVLMRPTMVALLFAIMLALIWRAIRGQSNWLELAIAFVMIIAAALAFYHYDPRRGGSAGEGEYEVFFLDMLRHPGFALLRKIPGNAHELFEATMIKALYGCALWRYVNTFFGVVVLLLGFSLFRYRVLWGLWFSVTIAMLLLQKPLDRYFLPVIPLLIFAWWRFLVWFNHRLPLHWGNVLFMCLFAGGMGTNIARIGEMVVEQRRVPFSAHYHEARYESAKTVAGVVFHHTGANDCILAEPRVGRVMTFLARRNVYDSTEEKIPFAAPGSRFFALLGPSWEEGKESRNKSADPVREWLFAHDLQLGPAVSKPVKGPDDSEPWVVYSVEPRK